MSDNEAPVLLFIGLEIALDPKITKAWLNETGKPTCTHTHFPAESEPNTLQYLAKVHYCTSLGWKFPQKCLDNWAIQRAKERQIMHHEDILKIPVFGCMLCIKVIFLNSTSLPPCLPLISSCIWKLDIPMEKLDCSYELRLLWGSCQNKVGRPE